VKKGRRAKKGRPRGAGGRRWGCSTQLPLKKCKKVKKFEKLEKASKKLKNLKKILKKSSKKLHWRQHHAFWQC
jgi:hypothetical protein